MKAHKHAEVIKAWADGAQVQNAQVGTENWVDCKNPIWVEEFQYRIKPEKESTKSSLSNIELEKLLVQNRGFCGSVTMARIIADAAVKRYIQDNE